MQTNSTRKSTAALKAAKMVTDLFEPGANVPDFLTDAVMNAVCDAAEVKGVNIWTQTTTGEDFNLAELARLFTLTNTPGFRLEGPRGGNRRDRTESLSR